MPLPRLRAENGMNRRKPRFDFHRRYASLGSGRVLQIRKEAFQISGIVHLGCPESDDLIDSSPQIGNVGRGWKRRR
jgi:hypothetical protein